MKRRTKAHFLTILLCMGVGFTACSNIAENTSEEDENVQKVKELSTGYIELTCGFDYTALDNAFDELN